VGEKGLIVLVWKTRVMSEVLDMDKDYAEMHRSIAQRATEKASSERWKLDVVIFLFAVLIIILILASQGIAIEVSAVVAIFGLSIGWIAGWRRGRRLYQRYYRDELARLEGMRGRSEEPAEATTEDIVQETMVKRWWR
jgi:hypothetical protein